jgi:hypothetical protein
MVAAIDAARMNLDVLAFGNPLLMRIRGKKRRETISGPAKS